MSMILKMFYFLQMTSLALGALSWATRPFDLKSLREEEQRAYRHIMKRLQSSEPIPSIQSVTTIESDQFFHEKSPADRPKKKNQALKRFIPSTLLLNQSNKRIALPNDCVLSKFNQRKKQKGSSTNISIKVWLYEESDGDTYYYFEHVKLAGKSALLSTGNRISTLPNSASLPFINVDMHRHTNKQSKNLIPQLQRKLESLEIEVEELCRESLENANCLKRLHAILETQRAEASEKCAINNIVPLSDPHSSFASNDIRAMEPSLNASPSANQAPIWIGAHMDFIPFLIHGTGWSETGRSPQISPQSQTCTEIFDPASLFVD